MVNSEAGLYDKTIKHLEENSKYILDRLRYEEMRGLMFNINNSN